MAEERLSLNLINKPYIIQYMRDWLQRKSRIIFTLTGLTAIIFMLSMSLYEHSSKKSRAVRVEIAPLMYSSNLLNFMGKIWRENIYSPADQVNYTLFQQLIDILRLQSDGKVKLSRNFNRHLVLEVFTDNLDVGTKAISTSLEKATKAQMEILSAKSLDWLYVRNPQLSGATVSIYNLNMIREDFRLNKNYNPYLLRCKEVFPSIEERIAQIERGITTKIPSRAYEVVSGPHFGTPSSSNFLGRTILSVLLGLLSAVLLVLARDAHKMRMPIIKD